MEKLSLDQFKAGLIMTIAGALLLFLFNWCIGKNELFLLLNEDLGKGADYLFIFFTFLGDGIWWIAMLILFILFRKKFLPLLLFSFAFSEIFIESFKNFIIHNEPRPITAIARPRSWRRCGRTPARAASRRATTATGATATRPRPLPG